MYYMAFTFGNRQLFNFNDLSFRRGKATGDYGVTEFFGGQRPSLQEGALTPTQSDTQWTDDYKQATAAGDMGAVQGLFKDNSGSTQTTSNNTSSSGGSSSGGSSTNIQPTTNTAGDNLPKPDSFYNQLNNVFDDVNSVISARENNLRQQFPSIQEGIRSSFDAEVPLFQQARDTGLNRINEAKTGVERQSQSALDSARNLYNQLNQRNLNVFGGGNSAGLASSEILGREAQSNFGNIRQKAVDAVQVLESNAREIESNLQAQLQNLEARKQAGLRQAEVEFRQRLDGIENMRGEAAFLKARERVNALTDFRNRYWQIEDESRQLAQQIEMMKQSELSNIRQAQAQYQAQLDAFGSGAQDLYNSTGQDMYDTAGNYSGELGVSESGYNPLLTSSGSYGRREDERMA